MRRARSATTRRRARTARAVLVGGTVLLAVAAGAGTAGAEATVLRPASSAGAAAAPRIVGGAPVPVAVVPYQVRIRSRHDGRPWGSPGPYRYSSCGGALIDAQHVVTAAHCATHDGLAAPPGSFRVDTGISRFEAAAGSGGDPLPQVGDTPQSRSVAVVRRHPGYHADPSETGALADLVDDVVVLTLASPVTLDANTAPIPLADPGPSPTGLARVSGFGLQADGGRADGALYALDVPLVDASLPESAGGAAGLNALYAISRSPAGTTCQGDSGGPLIQGGRLIGVVSSGRSCGVGSPSNHTLVAAPEIRDFVLGDDTPPVAPRGGQDVALRAPAAPATGDALRCDPGTWTGDPAFAYTFVDARSGDVLRSGPGARYVLAPGDVGRSVACRATATTAGGVGRTPQTRPTRATARGARARLRARLTSTPTVPRGGRLVLRVAVANDGPGAASAVRTCVRPGSRFWVLARGGGTIVDGRVCWTTSSIRHGTVKRLVLRSRRHAARGRTLAATASVTAPSAARAAASLRVTVGR